MTKSALIIHPEYNLYQRGNNVFCSSLQVAESFDKRHDHVLRDIETLNCSDEFRVTNFQKSSYIDIRNRKQLMYYMTRDGFIHLAMSYRGRKAGAIREEIIKNGFHSNIN